MACFDKTPNLTMRKRRLDWVLLPKKRNFNDQYTKNTHCALHEDRGDAEESKVRKKYRKTYGYPSGVPLKTARTRWSDRCQLPIAI
jgi:hypothetical protein